MTRPTFADPRNAFVFHRIFGSPRRTDILVAFLHDLLDLDEAHRIASVELLPPTQRPRVPELALALVNVRCTDIRGIIYVAAIQVLQVEGFESRLVYDVARAYVLQPAHGAGAPGPGDVVGITVCDFALWPDAEDRLRPMLTRWRMIEQPPASAERGQTHLIFLELPKYDASHPPRTAIEKWAYFFREADSLSAVSEVLGERVLAKAIDATRIARFTVGEWDAYIDAGIAIQSQRGALAIAERRGRQRRYEEGREEGLRQGIEVACSLLGIELTEERRAELAGLGIAELEALLARLRERRSWS